MILSDFDLDGLIKDKRLIVDPFDPSTLKENGLDLRLDDEIGIFNQKYGKDFVLDPSNINDVKDLYSVEKHKEQFVIGPRSHVLLSTLEFLKLPDDLMGIVELRSTWARYGLSMPPTIIDAGFAGTIVLEITNNAPFSIVLRPKTRFAHVVFAKTLSRVRNAYKGSYTEQRGVRPPKPMD